MSPPSRWLAFPLGAAIFAGVPPQAGNTTVITDVAIVDVNAGVSRLHQTVVIRGSRIERVASASDVPTPAGAQAIDGGGDENQALSAGVAFRFRRGRRSSTISVDSRGVP